MNKVERQTAIVALKESETPYQHMHGSKWMQDSAKLVEKYILDYTQVKESEKVALVHALNSNVQVRDYAMGLLTPEQLPAYLDLLNWAPRREWMSAQACLVSQIYYEKGDKDKAVETISIANAKYPLAQLLRRVYTVGWDSNIFKQMREELHPKVVEVIFGEAVA